ncbi:MAG: TIGR02594 family protein [Cyclobacteriaceae bacterium]
MSARRLELLDVAMSQYGIMEVRGIEDNKEITKYFDALGFDGSQLKDETAWCAAFANYCLKTACLPYSGKLNARSFLTVGLPTKHPIPGDLVVLWREDRQSWKGHVGFYVNHDERFVYLLGGNQSNMVNIAAYPINRLLEYRSVVI